ncbi:hypothetical protein WDW86_03325 [Bdellovibrionota bacterium FG-2]
MRIAFAGFFIYLGVRVLVGGGSQGCCHFSGIKGGASHENAAVFADGKFTATNTGSNKFSVVFGKGTFDLTGISVTDKDVSAEINTVFGEGIVLIDPKTPVKITANSVLAEARLPDQNMVAIGSLNYVSESAKTAPHVLNIQGNVVFGSLRFVMKGTSPDE